MSNKSGVSKEVISLPQGGGAVQGLGEKFSPDLHTGTGNFTMPIQLPEGRNGFQPKLNLVYSTGNGNGIFGLGFGLDIPNISRKTSKGLPKYIDKSLDPLEWDTFILSGSEDLVPFIQDQNSNFVSYKPRTEGLFAQIRYYNTEDNNYWLVKTKDGLTSYYGSSADDYQSSYNASTVMDGAQSNKIFKWNLTQTKDTFGNKIVYTYEKDKLENHNEHCFNQSYLSKISYMNYGDESNQQFLVEVKFIYEDRPDPFSEYRAGFEIRTTRRCKGIEIYSYANPLFPIRTYHFKYLDQLDTLLEQTPYNLTSLLSQIHVEGHNGHTSERLPTIEFSYTTFNPFNRRYENIKAISDYLPERSLHDGNYELVDLFGNGLPDIVHLQGKTRYWKNLGNGVFDLPRNFDYSPLNISLINDGIQLADLNGDGRTDLLVFDDTRSGYFSFNQKGGWDKESYTHYDKLPSFSFKDPNVKLVDLDGDGVTDVLRTGSNFEIFFHDPINGFTESQIIPRKDIAEFPNVYFKDSRVRLADMTGDGLQDIVMLHNGRVEYWPYYGYGKWGKRITMLHSPIFENLSSYSGIGYDPKRIILGDIDGDGISDLIYIGDGFITIWINQNGNAWSSPIIINGTPSISNTDSVRIVDLYGNGTSGILWTYDFHPQSDSNYKYLDLNGGVKPYLLNQIDNNMGAITKVEYTSSIYFYLKDEEVKETRWKTNLPFPVQVVSGLEVTDYFSKGKKTTKYRYHDGYWDGVEREFRGFGYVEQLDSETFEDYNKIGLEDKNLTFNQVGLKNQKKFSPPILTKSWFHQGPIETDDGFQEYGINSYIWNNDPQILEKFRSQNNSIDQLSFKARRDALRTLRGKLLRKEVYALDGSSLEKNPYTITENLYDVREEIVQHNLNPKMSVFFPFVISSRTTQWERGNDPMNRFTFIDFYDKYGQPQQKTNIAVPRGRKFLEYHQNSQPYLVTHEETVYGGIDENNQYLVDRKAHEIVFEILNNGEVPLNQLYESIKDGTSSRKVIKEILYYYDGDEFTGLPVGQIGLHGSLTRSESLVLTEDILHEAYINEDRPFIFSDHSTADVYPAEFKGLVKDGGGYIYHSKNDSVVQEGYYVITSQFSYDFQDNSQGNGRGMVKASGDSLGNKTFIEYDYYDLFPVKVTNAAGLTSHVIYDYRSFKVSKYEDFNHNRTVYRYTPIGLLESISVMGKEGEEQGDIIDKPSTIFKYDLLAYEKSKNIEKKQPVFTHIIKREKHSWDIVRESTTNRIISGPPTGNDLNYLFPENEIDAFPERFIQYREYTDGFSRVLQTRKQADDVSFGDSVFGNHTMTNNIIEGKLINTVTRVIVDGWKTYDNKGQIIEQYEPFFSDGWDYLDKNDANVNLFGAMTEMYYDPRGQLIRTVLPNASEQRIIFGIPIAIDTPEDFIPTPWESYTYDTNDNAGRTHPNESKDYSSHWNTPTSIEIDALGRTIKTIARNGLDPNNDWFISKSSYDILGNPLLIIDPKNRIASKHIYDLGSKMLSIDNIDAGMKSIVYDALGNELVVKDSKGAMILKTYDSQNRLTRVWARNHTNQAISIREMLFYGDSLESELTTEEAITFNLLGNLYKNYDEAGLEIYESYDFKGNILEKIRKVIKDSWIISSFNSSSNSLENDSISVDWGLGDNQLLEHNKEFRTSLSLDAMNRITTMTYPADVDGGPRKSLVPTYNRAGGLRNVKFNGDVYVENIAYNAKGQRTFITYGNGVITRYLYDSKTFRLLRMVTGKFKKPSSLTYQFTGEILQDIAYSYDLSGNMLNITDSSPNSGVPNSILGRNKLVREFSYDPLYRLNAATGRECGAIPSTPWNSSTRCADLKNTVEYKEQYRYDQLGNMLQLKHHSTNGEFKRIYDLSSTSNRLSAMTVGSNEYNYLYDNSGNLLREGVSRQFEWDYSNRLLSFRNQVEDSNTTLYVRYLYDGSGKRVKKLVRNQGGGIEVTVYIDEIFEYHAMTKLNEAFENNTMHIMDNQNRIATVRIGESFPDDQSPAIKYHLSDHLGSSNIVIDNLGTWTNKEEYTPFGDTSFGSYSRKRYRFGGKERDNESGLYYHGARYYAPWLSKWVSTDPLGMVDGHNLYQYVSNNPLRYIDPSGTVEACFSQDESSQMSLMSDSTNESYPVSTDISEEPTNESSGLSPETRAAAAFSSSAGPVYEWSLWNPNTGVDRATQLKIDSNRGFAFDRMAGNNLGRNAKNADYVTDAVVGQTKSTRSTNTKYVRDLTRRAAKDAKKFIDGSPADAGKVAEARIVVPTGTSDDIVEAAETALGGRKPIKGAQVKVTRGLPGKTGVTTKALGAVGAVTAGYGLYQDVKNGDVASGIGDGTSLASTGLTAAGSYFGSTSLAMGGAVTGAFAGGYGIGTLIDEYLLPEDAKIAIGGTLNEIVNEGGLKELILHPFGIGM